MAEFKHEPEPNEVEELRKKLNEAYDIMKACIPYVEAFFHQTRFGDGAKHLVNKLKDLTR